MKRNVQSAQAGCRIIAFIANAAGTALTGIDAKQVTMTDTGTGVKTIELGGNLFSSASDYVVQVTTATAGTTAQVSITDKDTFVINTFDDATGVIATDAICHVLVIGANSERR